MALIDCPECGREVSSSAAACPVCAYPVATGTPPVPSRAVSRTPIPEWWKTAASIVVRLGLGGILIAAGGDESEATIGTTIGGLIIGASAIPVFYRDAIERLKAGQAGRVLDERFKEQMGEMEQRHQEQMDRIEQMHAEQMIELEERVDFAERLLTKQREQNTPV